MSSLQFHKPTFTFTGISWSVLVGFAGLYCYLHGFVAQEGQPDLLFSMGWSLRSWLLWFVLIPFIYRAAKPIPQQANALNQHFIKTIKLGLVLCSFSICCKLLVDWWFAENLVGNLYYYLPREFSAFIFISVAAHFVKYQVGLAKEATKNANNEAVTADEIKHTNKELFMVSKGQQQVMLKRAEIDWVIACGNYVEIYALGDKYITRATMKSLQEQLGDSDFLRIHRSYIVNKQCIKAIRNSKSIQTHCGQQLPLGKTYKKQVADISQTTLH